MIPETVRNQRRREAEAFNAKLRALPFRWQPGIKMVRSGLLANSSGDGRSRATVVHITLLEPYRAPRLVRFYGDFLCTAGKAAIGSHWDGHQEESVDGEGVRYPAKITCKTCLRRAGFILGESIK